MIKDLFTLAIAFAIVLNSPNKAYTQNSTKFTISGYVKEAHSSETLPGVSVSVLNQGIGTASNSYGFYSITLPSAEQITLEFSSVGYKNQRKTFALTQNVELDILLEQQNESLEEVIVEAGKVSRLSQEAQMSKIDIPVQQIKDIPALLGEKDMLKVLQLMPGVQKGSEGTSGIYVRGGGPDQNLIILDEAPVYNAFHLFGFFSLFNGEAMKSLELTKGGFPAQYGGRLSSVININMKDGNKQKFGGNVGIGLVATKLTLEGPIVKNKSSFLVSGRRTYIDILARPFFSDEGSGGYFFYDYNLKANYEFSKKDKIYLSGYFGKDKFFARSRSLGEKSEFGLQWGNATSTLRWNHQFHEKLFANTSFIFSHYRFKIYQEKEVRNQNYELSYFSGITDYGIKADFDYIPSPKHYIKAGITSTYHRFTPSAIVFNGVTDLDFETKINVLESLESGIYLQDQFKPWKRLNILGGIRISNFITQGRGYTYPEPRISASYQLVRDLSIKASYAMMNQYIHLLTNTGSGLPTDLWVPSTKNVSPQQSNQLAAGFAKDFSDKNFSISIEGYYKKSDRVIGYKEGASFLLIEDPSKQTTTSWEKNVTQGQGWSYGAEFLLQRKFGKLTGWIGYTLSWTQLQFDSLNFGEKFYARYDRRHDISIVGIYKPNERITFSATWVYGTGNAITLPIGTYSANTHSVIPNSTSNYGGNWNYNTQTVNDYGAKNDFRMAPYHRLDLGVQFHKELDNGWIRTWEISLYNAYNRKNPYFYFPSQETKNGETFGVLKQISLFTLIPAISYNLKF